MTADDDDLSPDSPINADQCPCPVMSMTNICLNMADPRTNKSRQRAGDRHPDFGGGTASGQAYFKPVPVDNDRLAATQFEPPKDPIFT